MHRSALPWFLILFLFPFCFVVSGAEDSTEKKPSWVHKSLKGLKFEALAYLDYSHGVEPLESEQEEDFSEFKTTRGYFTVKKKFKPWLSMRITLDAHQDDTGDYKVRHKYLYGEVGWRDLGFLTGLKSEIGVGHMPWLDFEEHINPYRCQGTMAIERAGIFNSADGGISLKGSFGGKLENAEEKTGGHNYDGKWGSWHVGIYNGGGYHASEKNTDKTIQGRITVRPFTNAVPGLQFSYFGISGAGNVADTESLEAPDYEVHMGMLSFQRPGFVATAQSFKTKGNAKGNYVDGEGRALDTSGYSLFLNSQLGLCQNRLWAFARFDHFNSDDKAVLSDQAAHDLLIAGFSYEMFPGNLVLLTYETTDYDADSGGKKHTPEPGANLGDDHKVQAVMQLKF